MSEITNYELRRRIFDLLGYMLYQGVKGYWVLQCPDGRIKSVILGNHIAESKVFTSYLENGEVLNWPEDLNAAAELLKRMPGYSLEWHQYQWVIAVTTQWICADKSPARAICLAFVAMHEEKAND